jgi:hypothetical protein
MDSACYPLPFSVDHIVAAQHGGETEANNLALACLHCNRHKGPNIAGLDSETGGIVRLYNPRTDAWSAHFEWRGAELIGRTPIGRATVRVCAINAPDIIAVRLAIAPRS